MRKNNKHVEISEFLDTKAAKFSENNEYMVSNLSTKSPVHYFLRETIFPPC